MDEPNHTSSSRMAGGPAVHRPVLSWSYGLDGTYDDPNQKLAWVNSVCVLILSIGVLGARFGSFRPRPVAAVEQSVPAIVEQLPPPPQTTEQITPQERSEQPPADTPQVVVVTPNAPNINFSVPTIGNLVVPNAIASPPPLNPLAQPAPLKAVPSNLNNTGAGGDRPEPPYPRIALQTGQQGSVTLMITSDEAGNVIDVQVEKSSGSPVLDRSSVEFVKRHWRLPVGASTRLFETTVNYRLAE